MSMLLWPLGQPQTGQIFLSATGSLVSSVGVGARLVGGSTFVVSGLQLASSTEDDLIRVTKYVGEQNVPGDIKRLRRSVSEVMRRMGQPVIVKHMWNDEDVKAGIAEASPNFDTVYGQSRNRDPISWGMGFCSKVRHPEEWITATGQIEHSVNNPGGGAVQAPKYRGFGPGYLTYLVEPDVAEDLFKLTPGGALIKVQQQTAQCGWFPEVNDNDLIVNVTLDSDGRVVDTHERYQAKMTNPTSIRGLDRKGRREYSGDNGNRHVVNQAFEMSLIPAPNVLYNVEVDR